jgi:hypothetical protein
MTAQISPNPASGPSGTVVTVADRLSRRGKLSIEAVAGAFSVRLVVRGPYGYLSWCTSDKADYWSYCHLGPSNWHGEGPDLDALLAECEEATRPRYRDVDALRWEIGLRRESRTCGPPLPEFRKWEGWRPGDERWLRCSSHATEYLDGYLHHDIEGERKFNAERAEIAARTERLRVQRVLEGR